MAPDVPMEETVLQRAIRLQKEKKAAEAAEQASQITTPSSAPKIDPATAPWARFTVDSSLTPQPGEAGSFVRGSAEDAVDEAVDSITMYEAYQKLVGPDIEPPNKVDGNFARCPTGRHADNNWSAYYNRETNFLCCGTCNFEGWDVRGLAALRMGIDTKSSDYTKMVRDLALQFRGVDYQALHAQDEMNRLSAANPAPSSPPDPSGFDPSAPQPPLSTPQPPLPNGNQPPAPGLASVTQMPGTSLIDPSQPSEAEVALELRRMRARDSARDKKREEEASSAFTLPTVTPIRKALATPRPAIEWTIDGLHPVGSSTTIAAKNKAGKTTLMLNLVKSLVDGTPFIGTHKVRQIEGRVLFLNFEVIEDSFLREIEDMGIVDAEDKFLVSHLKGMAFDLVNSSAAYQYLVDTIVTNQVETLIIDPFSEAFFGDENDNSDVTKFTKRIDQLKLESGVKDLFLPVHMGRGEEERARGASKIDDWADTKWLLVRDEKDSKRYFKATGRRVQADEGQEVVMDPLSKLLAYSGAKQRNSTTSAGKKTQSDVLRDRILDFLKANPGANRTVIATTVTGKNTDILGQLAIMENLGDLDTQVTGTVTQYWLAGTRPIKVL